MLDQAEAVALLEDVLRNDVLAVEAVSRAMDRNDGGHDIHVRMRDGAALAIDVTVAAHPTPEALKRLMRRPGTPDGTVNLLVSDFLSEEARRLLADAGWAFFDRRGRLYLAAPGTHIDVTIGARRRPGNKPLSPIRGARGTAVVLAHLLDPTTVLGVRELARAAGMRSATSVTNARRSLHEANLVEPDGTPIIPELFWTLAENWATPLRGLAQAPTADDLARSGENVDGPFFASLDQLAAAPESVAGGAAIGGDLAAELLGAPVVRTRESPFDIWVSSPAVVDRLVRQCGEARRLVDRAAGVRVVPVSLASSLRLPPRPGSHGLPISHPLLVALDLAQDPARGREILADFEPDGARRVW